MNVRKKDRTDRETDGRQTVTLRLPLDAVNVTMTTGDGVWYGKSVREVLYVDSKFVYLIIYLLSRCSQ